ncbi:MAG: response regulator transcription factor [Hyphomicrobiaceae bacterium]
MRILVVEDERNVAADLQRALQGSGHVVEHAADGEAAWFLGDTESYDLVVLDLGLPKLDGLQVLKRWRANARSMQVLVLTARDSWTDKVEAIDAGADDYLTKPFHMAELLARVRALLRRQTPHSNSILTVESIAVDTRYARVTKDGTPIDLSPLEYRLLHYLVHHAGRAVSQLELTEHVYAQNYERDSNAIEVLVKRLRGKLGAGAIKTRRGYGYFVGTPDEQSS